MEVDSGASVRIDIKCDGVGEWQEKARFSVTNKRSFSVPIIPRRCDTMRLRISGIGGCRIYSISKIVEKGSEL